MQEASQEEDAAALSDVFEPDKEDAALLNRQKEDFNATMVGGDFQQPMGFEPSATPEDPEEPITNNKRKKRKESEAEPRGQLQVSKSDKSAYNRHILAKGTDAQWLEKKEAKKKKTEDNKVKKVAEKVCNKEKLKNYDAVVKKLEEAMDGQQRERDAKRKQIAIVKGYKLATQELIEVALKHNADATELDNILFTHVSNCAQD